jgi:hypothetical protein
MSIVIRLSQPWLAAMGCAPQMPGVIPSNILKVRELVDIVLLMNEFRVVLRHENEKQGNLPIRFACPKCTAVMQK